MDPLAVAPVRPTETATATHEETRAMTGRSPTWCSTCGTQHGRFEECPGELVAVEEERNGWRVTVVTPHGLQTMGVRVADTGGVWRARILTFPNILWAVPDGRGTIKFVGGSPQEAEQRAFCRMNRRVTITCEVKL